MLRAKDGPEAGPRAEKERLQLDRSILPRRRPHRRGRPSQLTAAQDWRSANPTEVGEALRMPTA